MSLFKTEHPLLDHTISYHQFLVGASSADSRNRYEDTLEPGQFTLKELLHIKISPRLLFGTLVREKILPDDIIHKLSLSFCYDFLDRLANEAIPNDSRHFEILEKKKLWIENKLSSKELEETQREAHKIFSEINEENAAYKDAASYAVYCATLTNSSESIRGVMKATSKIFDTENEYRRWQDLLLKELTKK